MWIGPWYPAVPSFCLSTSHLCCHPVLPISILPQPPLPTLEVPKNKIVYTLVSILNISRQSLVFLDVCGSKTSTSISNLACLIITSCVWTESSFKLGGKCVSAKQHGRSAASLPLCVLFIKTRDKQADMRDYSVVQRKNAGEIVTRTEVFFTNTVYLHKLKGRWKQAGSRRWKQAYQKPVCGKYGMNDSQEHFQAEDQFCFNPLIGFCWCVAGVSLLYSSTSICVCLWHICCWMISHDKGIYYYANLFFFFFV